MDCWAAPPSCVHGHCAFHERVLAIRGGVKLPTNRRSPSQFQRSSTCSAGGADASTTPPQRGTSLARTVVGVGGTDRASVMRPRSETDTSGMAPFDSPQPVLGAPRRDLKSAGTASSGYRCVADQLRRQEGV